MTIWTIGHSNRSIEDFIAALKVNGIQLLVDVRRFPASRHNPQFERQALASALHQSGIEYKWMGQELGGRRRVDKHSLNTSLRNSSFRGYADYMLTESFKNGIDALRASAGKKRAAIMCAELLWWRCHRSMISDYLEGVFADEVIHIRDTEHFDSHTVKNIARVEGKRLVYDGNANRALF